MKLNYFYSILNSKICCYWQIIFIFILHIQILAYKIIYSNWKISHFFNNKGIKKSGLVMFYCIKPRQEKLFLKAGLYFRLTSAGCIRWSLEKRKTKSDSRKTLWRTNKFYYNSTKIIVFSSNGKNNKVKLQHIYWLSLTIQTYSRIFFNTLP